MLLLLGMPLNVISYETWYLDPGTKAIPVPEATKPVLPRLPVYTTKGGVATKLLDVVISSTVPEGTAGGIG
jgi:hypothetical protein